MIFLVILSELCSFAWLVQWRPSRNWLCFWSAERIQNGRATSFVFALRRKHLSHSNRRIDVGKAFRYMVRWFFGHKLYHSELSNSLDFDGPCCWYSSSGNFASSCRNFSRVLCYRSRLFIIVYRVELDSELESSRSLFKSTNIISQTVIERLIK